MSAKIEITTVDKLSLLPLVARDLASLFYRLITRSFVGGAKANDLFKDVVYAAVRTNLTNISPGAEQWVNKSTETEYLTFAKSKGFQPDTDVLGSGLKVHWLGAKTAEKILLYFHGGGYVLCLTPGHLDWLFNLQEELSKTTSTAVVVVSYTLAPHAQYPSQLQQAAESLEWLTNSQKKKPSNIFVGGDSAGGNMALALLSHLLHPHADVKNDVKLAEPLAGAILVSPWTKFPTDDDSVKRNAYSDFVTPEAAQRWSALFMGSAKQDNYNQAYYADAQWFKGLDSVVKDILVWGGGGEVLIDSINVTAKKLQEAHPRVEYIVQPNAAHEEFMMERNLGYKAKAEGTEVVESWMKARY